MSERSDAETPAVTSGGMPVWGSTAWFVFLFGAIFVFYYLDRAIVSVTGEAIRRDLGLSDSQLGMLGGFGSLFTAVFSIPLARLAERQSRVRIMVFATAFWSAMTMACGVAGAFLPLLMYRIGVGMGEAGFVPPLVSTVADRFPLGRRATIMSLIMVGAPLGGALAAIGGGWVTGAFGWRAAYLVAGLPGLLLAVLMLLTIAEPRRSASVANLPPPSFGNVLRSLARSSSFIHVTLASAWLNFVGFGLTLFLIPLLVRRFGLPISHAGLAFGLTISATTALAAGCGGFIADRLSRRTVQWYAWAPAVLLAAAIPLYFVALSQGAWIWMMVILCVPIASVSAFGPTFAVITQSLVEPGMRASTAALHGFVVIAFGFGLGALTLGFLSDQFAINAYGPTYLHDCRIVGASIGSACGGAAATGLQRALLAGGLALVFALVHLLIAARALKRDMIEKH